MKTKLLGGQKVRMLTNCPYCETEILVTGKVQSCPTCQNQFVVQGYSESFSLPLENKVKASGPKNFIHQNQMEMILEDIRLGIEKKYTQEVIINSLMEKYEGLSKSHARRKYLEVVGKYSTGPHAEKYWSRWLNAHLDEFQRLGGTLKTLWSVFGTDNNTDRTWRGLERGEYEPKETFMWKYYKLTGSKAFRRFQGNLLEGPAPKEPFYPCEFCQARGTEGCATCVVLLHHLIPNRVSKI